MKAQLSPPQDLKMPTLKISAQYREPPMLIVPSAAGFPFVFKPAMRTRGLCRLSTTLGMAMTAAVLWIAVVSFAPAAAAARSDYHISAGCASAVHDCSVLAGQYSQHDWLRPCFRAEVRSAISLGKSCDSDGTRSSAVAIPRLRRARGRSKEA